MRHKCGFQMQQVMIGWKRPQRVKRPNSTNESSITDQGSGLILLSLLYPVHVPCMEPPPTPTPNLFDIEVVCLEALRMVLRQ